MDIRKNLKGSGMGLFIVVIILLSSASSWGDIRLMVDQDGDGSLGATIWDKAIQNTAVTGLPNGTASPIYFSCTVPSVNWDSDAGAWVLFGANDDGSMWSATISCTQTACTFTPNNYKNVACHLALPTSTCLTAIGNYSGGTVAAGTCGTANGQPYSSLTSTSAGLCGTGSSVSNFVSTGSGWTWYCTTSGGSSPQCSASLSGGGGGTAGCPTATSTFVYIPGGSPATGGGLGMSSTNPQTITAYGEKHYFFCLSKPPTTSIQISMATEDWQTNQDVLVSNVSQPSCSQDPNNNTRNVAPNPPPWYNILSGSTESVLMSPPANQNLVYYVTVCSQSNMTGKFGLYWAVR